MGSQEREGAEGVPESEIQEAVLESGTNMCKDFKLEFGDRLNPQQNSSRIAFKGFALTNDRNWCKKSLSKKKGSREQFA